MKNQLRFRRAVSLAAFYAVIAAGLSGCGGGTAGPAPPISLQVVSFSMPDTVGPNTPVTYTATVLLRNQWQSFERFAAAQPSYPYALAAVGRGPEEGRLQERLEEHTGTLTFATPGTYLVEFPGFRPAVQKSIEVR